jgi:hypothetical protein
MSDSKPVIRVGGTFGEGFGCALMMIALALCLGGGCVIVDKVFDRLERLEQVKQGASK